MNNVELTFVFDAQTLQFKGICNNYYGGTATHDTLYIVGKAATYDEALGKARREAISIAYKRDQPKWEGNF